MYKDLLYIWFNRILIGLVVYGVILGILSLVSA